MLLLVSAVIPLLVLLGLIGLGWSGFDLKAAKFTIAVPVCVLFALGLDSCVSYGRTHFKEVWNFRISAIEHHEFWDEEVSCRHPHYVTKTRTVTKTDSKGRSYTTTETYQEQDGYEHAYDVDEHPEHWTAVDEYGHGHGISYSDYVSWQAVWHNEVFVNLHHTSVHSRDGNAYRCTWPGTFETIYPWSSIEQYENKVRVSRTNFGFRTADKATVARFPRPVDQGDVSVLHGYGVAVDAAAEAKLRRMNADFGKTYRIHTLVLLFDCAKDGQDVMLAVRDAWQGPNKNELVVCIGMTQSGVIDWVDVMSWMDDTTIHALIRQDLTAQVTPGTAPTFNGDRLVQVLRERIPKYWQKKDFRAFDYLGVETPWWVWLICVIFAAGAGVGALAIIEAYEDRPWQFLKGKMTYGR